MLIRRAVLRSKGRVLSNALDLFKRETAWSCGDWIGWAESMHHLVGLINELKERGVGFRSLRDGGIDTTTASGELIFNIFASLAQFERSLIRERTVAGLSAARARGRVGGGGRS